MAETVKVKTSTSDVFEDVKKAIAESNDSVAERVKAHFVDEEVGNRVTLVVDGLNKLSELKKKFNKYKPDNITYNEDGTEASSSWSKEKLKERNESQGKITKLETALEEALASADYEKLKNLK